MYDARTHIIAEQLKSDNIITKYDTESVALLGIVKNAAAGNPVRDATISNGIAYFDRVTASQPLVSLKLNIPVTQTGSGTPSPDNIRDFIGFSGVNIGQTSDYGKYFQGLLNGTYGFVDLGDLSWQYQEEYETFRSGVNRNVKVGTPNCICSVYLFNPDAIGTNPSSISSILNDKEITTYKNENNQGRFVIKDTNYTDVDSFKTAVSGMKVIYESAEPSTPVTPQEFAMLCQAFGITGNTYQITFGQTVYSANLDVLTGKLSITHRMTTFDGSSDELWGVNTAFVSMYYISLDLSNKPNGLVMSDKFIQTFVSGASMVSGDMKMSYTNLNFKNDNITTLEDWKTWLTNNPLQVVTELATPIEIQLTPTQITTLIGENVIFADVADVTECKYTRK